MNNTHNPKRSVRLGIDPKDGEEVVYVPLANRAVECRLFKEDYDRLMALGLSPNWCLNDAGTGQVYVRAALDVRGNLITIARVMAGVGHGERVQYRDWDALNLRSDNLHVTRGYARRTDAILVAAVSNARVAA